MVVRRLVNMTEDTLLAASSRGSVEHTDELAETLASDGYRAASYCAAVAVVAWSDPASALRWMQHS
jgi:hypothetical protein